MNFKRTTCEICNKTYDELEQKCPKCHSHNKLIKQLKYPPIFWISYFKELIIFIIGFIGLSLFNIVYSYLLPKSFSNAQLIVLVNLLSYGSIFVLLLIVLYPYLSSLIKQFKNIRAYIVGVFYAVALVALGTLWSMIQYGLFGPQDVNQNQLTINSIIHNYPVVAFILFCIIGPIAEEITYRIGLFSFSRRINRLASYLITIIIFALIHTNFSTNNWFNELINLPSYLIGGFVLCFVYEKEGIAASTTTHILNNVLSFGLIMVLM